MTADPKLGDPGFVAAVREAAFASEPVDEVFGPKVHEAVPPEPAPRLRQTEMRPLAAIQEQLRAETKAGTRGGRPRRQA